MSVHFARSRQGYCMDGLIKMVAGHLNTPYGVDTILGDHLVQALQSGTVYGLDLSALQNELIHGMFAETNVSTLIKCIELCGASWESVKSLYEESLNNYAYPVKEFEKVIVEAI